jgi:hypothetical protein
MCQKVSGTAVMTHNSTMVINKQTTVKQQENKEANI